MLKQIATLLLITGTAASAQQTLALHYEVVSVRPSKPNPDGSYSVSYRSDPHNSHLDIVNLQELQLISKAFGVRDFDVEGLEGIPWAIYTIHASSGEEADAILHGMSESQAEAAKQRMFQEVIVERFHLRYHFVTRDVPSWLLITGNELKMHPYTTKSLTSEQNPQNDVVAAAGIVWHCSKLGCSIEAHGQSMQALAELFIPYLKAPIADRTGLTGMWDFNLRWWVPMMSNSDVPPDDAYPEPETGFPKQLGLKLQRGKAPRRILVVDHIEPPSPN